MQRSRPVMVVGGLLALVAFVVWVGTRDIGAPAPSTAAIESSVSAAPESTTAATMAPRSDRTVADSSPHTFVLPEVVDGVAVLEMTGGTFTFEVVGHGEETVQVLPETLDEGGRYYRLNHYRQGAAVSAEESADGVVWEALPLIPEAATNPNLVGAEGGVILMSYGYDIARIRPDSWSYWRLKDGDWLPLIGIAVDAGFASGPILRAGSGDEVLVTYREGPFSGLRREGLGCPGVRGVRPTEFGVSVNIVDMCGGEIVVGTLSLVGAGDTAVVVLVDTDGNTLWRSPPSVEKYFEQLLGFALSKGPEQASNANHILEGGGEQRFWTSTDGLRYELASTIPASPWVFQPVVVGGAVVVIHQEITLREDWRVGEPSRIRVLTSPDARVWSDAGLDVALPVGADLFNIALSGTRDQLLVTIPDRAFIGTPGNWTELPGVRSWNQIQALESHWLGLEHAPRLVLGVSSDGATWDAFETRDLIGALDCGTEFMDWRVVGDELWFSTWDGRGVCIIRGRFEPTT